MFVIEDVCGCSREEELFDEDIEDEIEDSKAWLGCLLSSRVGSVEPTPPPEFEGLVVEEGVSEDERVPLEDLLWFSSFTSTGIGILRGDATDC